MYYKAIRCSRCGWVQMTQAVKKTTCKICGNHINILKTPILHRSVDSILIRELIQEYNMKKIKNKGNGLSNK